MPTFNRSALIVESINSVIAQTFPNWELIVVDDGSTDDTVECVSAIVDERITVLSAGRIGNVARLRNLGAAAAKGRYLAFLDSDDIWVPQKLELQLSALRTAPGAWCYSNHGLLRPDGDCGEVRVGQFRAVSGRIGKELLSHETSAAMITWLVPRPLFDRAGGFDEALTLREDLDLAFRLAETADAIAIPQTLGFVREHSGRKTKSAADQHLKTALIFRRAAERAWDQTIKGVAWAQCARHLAAAARSGLRQGRVIAGVGLALRSLAASLASQPTLARLLARRASLT